MPDLIGIEFRRGTCSPPQNRATGQAPLGCGVAHIVELCSEEQMAVGRYDTFIDFVLSDWLIAYASTVVAGMADLFVLGWHIVRSQLICQDVSCDAFSIDFNVAISEVGRVSAPLPAVVTPDRLFGQSYGCWNAQRVGVSPTHARPTTEFSAALDDACRLNGEISGALLAGSVNHVSSRCVAALATTEVAVCSGPRRDDEHVDAALATEGMMRVHPEPPTLGVTPPAASNSAEASCVNYITVDAQHKRAAKRGQQMADVGATVPMTMPQEGAY